MHVKTDCCFLQDYTPIRPIVECMLHAEIMNRLCLTVSQIDNLIRLRKPASSELHVFNNMTPSIELGMLEEHLFNLIDCISAL